MEPKKAFFFWCQSRKPISAQSYSGTKLEPRNQGTKKQQNYAPRNEKLRTKKGVFALDAKVANLYRY